MYRALTERDAGRLVDLLYLTQRNADLIRQRLAEAV